MPRFAEAVPRQPALVGVLLRVDYKDRRPSVEQTFTPGLAAYLTTRYTADHPFATIGSVNEPEGEAHA